MAFVSDHKNTPFCLSHIPYALLDEPMAFLVKQMAMFPHSEYMVGSCDHYRSGNPHAALAASTLK